MQNRTAPRFGEEPNRHAPGFGEEPTELWIDKGASGEDIRRLLNHKTLSVTQKYIHRSDDRLRQFADCF